VVASSDIAVLVGVENGEYATKDYRVVYGHSLLLYNTLLHKFVWPCMGPFRLNRNFSEEDLIFDLCY
jgi:hypothetical protein